MGVKNWGHHHRAQATQCTTKFVRIAEEGKTIHWWECRHPVTVGTWASGVKWVLIESRIESLFLSHAIFTKKYNIFHKDFILDNT